MFWHSQNLNEKKVGDKVVKKSPWRHGRAWLHFGQENGSRGKCLGIEWVLGNFKFGHALSFEGGERRVTWTFCIPLLSLYLSYNGLGWEWLWKKVKWDHRRIGFRVFDWAIWWSFWENEMSWSSTDPWWMRWTFHIDNFLLGSMDYKTVSHSKHRIWIPLPEGEYLAEATYKTSTWKRKHWPWWPFKKVWESTEVDVVAWGGLPHEGKGENSWDCGRDGIYGYSSDGHDLAAAIAKGVESTLKSRRKYDGSIRAGYHEPVVRDRQGVEEFAKYVARVWRSEDFYTKWPKSKVTIDLEADRVIISLVREHRPQCIVTTQELARNWAGLVEKTYQETPVHSDDYQAQAQASA